MPKFLSRSYFLLALITLTPFIYPAAADTPSALVKSEFLFENPPFASCHASTIEASQGHLVAAFFAGSAEENPDVGIWVSRQEDGRWLPPIEVANGVQSPRRRYACWNPVLFQPKAGPLLLFYKVGATPRSWWGELIKSSDGGKSWSAPQRLPRPYIGPIKNKPVQLASGEILYPSSSEKLGWRVHFEKSDAALQKWETTKALNDGDKIQAIQPSLLSFGQGRWQGIGRTREGQLFSIESLDAGQTWSPMSLLELPNPNSGTDALTLRDGRQLLVYNHSDHKRTPLNVALSNDGKKWAMVLTLENTPGEFSYPAVIQTGDGLVHCTYTWNRKFIRHVVIDPAKLHTP